MRVRCRLSCQLAEGRITIIWCWVIKNLITFASRRKGYNMVLGKNLITFELPASRRRCYNNMVEGKVTIIWYWVRI